MENREEITLDIEGTLITCKKDELIANSDYFKVMLQGNFIEKDTNVIKLQDVDLKSFNVILKTLWDESYIVDDEDLLMVLQTACMLQFNHIRRKCIDKIVELMSPMNCLTIWQITDQLDIRPLNLKAKAMSLIEFLIIKDLDSILEVNVHQLFKYLSNTKLHVINEFDVFETCMKWYYENSKNENLCKGLGEEGIFKLFLSCIDFKTISKGSINEMLIYPDISTNNEIINILNDILKLKCNGNDVCKESMEFYNCKQRTSFYSPCILVDSFPRVHKRQKISATWYYDKFKRKRQSLILENVPGSSSSATLSKSILLYDSKLRNFLKLIDIPREKHLNLEGFQIIGYKEYIFLFGGEVCLGRGNWNNNFWVYDTIRERWERKTKLPCERRHFETCLAGDVLYIVGGTGSFRVIQDNMFYYKYKSNEWSRTHILPCPGRQVKCCDFQGKLFLLNVNGKCGYIFDIETNRWIQLQICDNNVAIIYPNKFSLFSYEDKLYMKGSSLTIMKIVNDELIVIAHEYLNSIHYDQIDSVLCDNFIYTIYTQTADDKKTVTLEEFDLKIHSSKNIFEKVKETSTLVVRDDVCRFSSNIKLFNFQHYLLSEEDTYICNYNV